MPGLPELLVILVIVFVLFGAGKLPQVMEALGTGLKRFREAQAEDPEPQDVKPSRPAQQLPTGSGATAPVTDAEEVKASSSGH